MSKYTLSPNAIRSLKNIGEYSLNKFGKKQTAIYLGNLHKRMRYLAENPKQGTQRTDLFPDGSCSSYFEGSHTIYYEIANKNSINIIDILHQSMEPSRHLE
ncbi:type II toxin-antitoxin system RelE/ParE family toxin [SAR92 clade bacterium H246]